MNQETKKTKSSTSPETTPPTPQDDLPDYVRQNSHLPWERDKETHEWVCYYYTPEHSEQEDDDGDIYDPFGNGSTFYEDSDDEAFRNTD